FSEFSDTNLCIFQPLHLYLLNPHPPPPSLTVPPTASPLNDTFCSASCKRFKDPSIGSPVAAAEHQEVHHPTTPPHQQPLCRTTPAPSPKFPVHQMFYTAMTPLPLAMPNTPLTDPNANSSLH